MKYKTVYKEYENVKLEVSSYVYGGIYVGVYNEEDGPISNLTVNVAGYPCKGTEAYIDTNNAPEAIDFIKEYKLGKVTKDYAVSGFCSYPKVIFDMDEVGKYVDPEVGLVNVV